LRLYILSVSPTEETSKAIDEAASIGAIGDMDAYMKFKAARAIGDAAQAGGEAAGSTQMGLGLGAGMAAAKMMAESLSSSPSQGAATPDAASDPMATLKMLKDMLDQGLISQEEYDSKKGEVLKRL
jgi:membrane protease subunit (stomatin/prohibitin family)